MSDVASLELCKELYKLSGWDLTYMLWVEKSSTVDKLGTDLWGDNVAAMSGMEADTWDGHKCPAYDLGYLLRKLPENWRVEVIHGQTSRNKWLANAYFNKTSSGLNDQQYQGFADTPEDAAAKLAIELIKVGVINPKNQPEERR